MFFVYLIHGRIGIWKCWQCCSLGPSFFYPVACEQVLRLGDILKSGRARGTRVARLSSLSQIGKFHISHDALLHTISSSFRTHVILSVQQDATVEQQWSDMFRRWNLLYVCCVDILKIFVLLFQKYILLSQRECFGRRYWLTCRPMARQSTQILREASARKTFASVHLVLTCLDKALHVQAISTCLSWNRYLLYVYGFFLLLFVIAVLFVRSIIHWCSEYNHINRTVTAQVAQARRTSSLLRKHSKYKDLYGKKTYRFCNLRKWKVFNKKQLTSLKMCVTCLLCSTRADIWPFYGFLGKRFSFCIKV